MHWGIGRHDAAAALKRKQNTIINQRPSLNPPWEATPEAGG